MLTALLTLIGVSFLILTVGRLLLLPFAIVAEVADARRRRCAVDSGMSVSLVVPAYNESVVLEACVRSVLAHRPPGTDVVLVDDGSTDDTYARMCALADEHPDVTALTQPNAGKAAALNRGIAATRGDVVLLIDADGVFQPDTIPEMIRPFADPRVGAVCGDDRPVNLDRVQTRFLAVTGHVGTGLMRRALTVLHCLPIVSGNAGAFRREVLADVGPLREDCIGEDLELTWRVHRAGHRVVFAPRALVYSESASTLRGLWRQRVRWGRGFVQSLWMHRDMVGRPRYGTFGISLAVLVFSALALPVLQLVALSLLVAAVAAGEQMPAVDAWWVLLWLGLPLSIALVVLAAGLNRALGDLRYGYTLLLWPAYSMMMTWVTVVAVWAEVRRHPRRWNKLERTGVRSAVGAG